MKTAVRVEDSSKSRRQQRVKTAKRRRQLQGKKPAEREKDRERSSRS